MHSYGAPAHSEEYVTMTITTHVRSLERDVCADAVFVAVVSLVTRKNTMNEDQSTRQQ